MRYSIHGPFEIERKDNGQIDRGKEAKRKFWDSVGQVDPCLPAGCGCYLFAVQAGKGIKPWYV